MYLNCAAFLPLHVFLDFHVIPKSRPDTNPELIHLLIQAPRNPSGTMQ